jgi:hypothetical protein
MIISFGLTVNELLSGTKTVTRRFWSQRQIDTILRLYGRGRREHQAWDKNPRCGGERIGTIRLTCGPYQERLGDMPESDLAAEGGMCATLEEFRALVGKSADDVATVIRFEFEPNDGGCGI